MLLTQRLVDETHLWGKGNEVVLVKYLDSLAQRTPDERSPTDLGSGKLTLLAVIVPVSLDSVHRRIPSMPFTSSRERERRWCPKKATPRPEPEIAISSAEACMGRRFCALLVCSLTLPLFCQPTSPNPQVATKCGEPSPKRCRERMARCESV